MEGLVSVTGGVGCWLLMLTTGETKEGTKGGNNSGPSYFVYASRYHNNGLEIGQLTVLALGVLSGVRPTCVVFWLAAWRSNNWNSDSQLSVSCKSPQRKIRPLIQLRPWLLAASRATAWGLL